MKNKNVRDLSLSYRRVTEIRPDPRNARRHSPSQIVRLTASITEFGFTAPVLIDECGQLIAGHARLEAAKAAGLEKVPCVVLEHLDLRQKRALAIADNRIGELSDWNPEQLSATLEELINADFNVEATGFSTAEIDVMFEAPSGESQAADPDDAMPEMGSDAPVTRTCDLWELGRHRLYCGDSRKEVSYQAVLGNELADLICADLPYNLKILGHVSGLGKVKHREFANASGEMSEEEFTDFLTAIFLLATRFSIDGSIHYQFIDWRHLREMLAAGYAAYTELKNLCVWNKGSGGMGSLYRSQHELIFVWKNGRAPHVNNVQLGKNGRYRANVWTVPGLNSFGAERNELVASHPTVKPTRLIADAIRDCSKVGGLVLDPFGGSGTTILAAERTRRRAALIEIDPRYVDVAIRRWQAKTGGHALLASSGRSFAEVAEERSAARALEGHEIGND